LWALDRIFSSPEAPLNPLQTVYRYHDATKHHLHRAARSLGYMDWDTQPDPFRRHEGADLTMLPRTAATGARSTWDGLFGPRLSPAPLDSANLGAFFYLSLALSAWKEVTGPDGQVVSRWPLRVNPSSGNLHPTEGWLATRDGVFHYRPDVHGLEQTADWTDDDWPAGLPEDAVFVGLSSIPWREAWKYGERAFRYCQHDAGHAMAGLSLAAAALGWAVVPIGGAGSGQMAAFLGIEGRDGPEAEHPDTVFAVCPGAVPGGPVPVTLPRARPRDLTVNALSPNHTPWDIIHEVSAAVEIPAGQVLLSPGPPDPETSAEPDRQLNAAGLIRGRRSAVALDGRATLGRAEFLRLLGRLMPGPANPAFALFQGRTAVSLLLMVHQVDDLPAGLYVLARDPAHMTDLKPRTRDDWQWAKPDDCPADLPLYFLGAGDLRTAAKQISCHQDIAGDGVFSLGMLARFDHTLQGAGPSAYPELFRETGAIGQMLYLEAEAAGLSGTGIGCFFDDEVHRVLGIDDHSWQSLYHFTVGRAVTDPRLRTAPPYGP